MRQRILDSHTPPCHRRMVITTLFSVFLAALQRRPVLYHTRWLLRGGGGGPQLWTIEYAFEHPCEKEGAGSGTGPSYR